MRFVTCFLCIANDLSFWNLAMARKKAHYQELLVVFSVYNLLVGKVLLKFEGYMKEKVLM